MNQYKQPKFSILHATARVPTGWIKAMKSWESQAVNPLDVEYILATHISNANAQLVHEIASAKLATGMQFHVVYIDGKDSAIKAWNRAAELARGEILIVAADDLFPPDLWDVDISLAAEQAMRTNAEFMLHCSTGSPLDDNLITHPIFSQALYTRWGYIFCDEYISMYGDNDNTERARGERVVVNARHIVFDHPTASLKKAPEDEVSRRLNDPDAYAQGEKKLRERRARRFDSILWQQQQQYIRPVVAMCLPGQEFSDVWVANLLSLFGHLQSRYTVAATFGYCSNVYMTRASIVNNLITAGQPIDYVLWLDDDNILSPQQFEMLKADLDTHPELAGVVGWCWIQPDNYAIEPMISCGIVADDLKSAALTVAHLRESESDLIEIGYSGFPVCLMRFDMLGHLGPHPFKALVDDRLDWGMASEDFSFFLNARAKGFKFAVDRRVKVPHFKRRAAEPESQPFEGLNVIHKQAPNAMNALVVDGAKVPMEASTV